MTQERPEMSDKAPVLGSWRRVYALEIGLLIAMIAAFAALTAHYAN